MSALRSLLAFLYDFIVGDDPLLFVVVAAGVSATAIIGATGNAWWLLPLVVCAGLSWSIWRVTRGT
jgi:hypothetical protein